MKQNPVTVFVRVELAKHGMSQEQLEKLAGVSSNPLTRLNKGEVRNTKTIRKILMALGLTADEAVKLGAEGEAYYLRKMADTIVPPPAAAAKITDEEAEYRKFLIEHRITSIKLDSISTRDLELIAIIAGA